MIKKIKCNYKNTKKTEKSGLHLQDKNTEQIDTNEKSNVTNRTNKIAEII